MDNVLFWYLVNRMETEKFIQSFKDVLDHVMAGHYSAEIKHCFYQLNLWALRNREDRIDTSLLSTPHDAMDMLWHAEKLTRPYPKLHEVIMTLVRDFDHWAK
jgi:hypothetical protein